MIFCLTIFSVNGFVGQQSNKFGFKIPKPGFLHFDQNPKSIFENYNRTNEVNSQDAPFFAAFNPASTRILQTSSPGARNLKVHVDFYSLESLEADKRVYIESEEKEKVNWQTS